MVESREPVTVQLLRRLKEGDKDAEQELFPALYRELRAIAHHKMAGEARAESLETTALVHEAWVRLVQSRSDWADRRHFLRVASRAMRSVLVDRARARQAAKRGGACEPRSLEPDQVGVDADDTLLVMALDECLVRLKDIDSQLAQVAELRCFAGLALPDIAEVMGLATRTIERKWRAARAWLQGQLEVP